MYKQMESQKSDQNLASVGEQLRMNNKLIKSGSDDPSDKTVTIIAPNSPVEKANADFLNKKPADQNVQAKVLAQKWNEAMFHEIISPLNQ